MILLLFMFTVWQVQSGFGLSTLVKEPTKILYVVSDDHNCSSLLSEAECHPLFFYVKNVSEYFTNNTVMYFTPGNHQLPSPTDAPVVNVTGISKFSMIGIGVVNYNMAEEGAPLPSSIISCNYSNRTQPRNGILFYKSSMIHIEKLTIENCGAMFTVRRPDNFKLVSALTYRESYDVTLIQVRIDSSLGFGLDADRIFGSFRVSKSAFVRSEAYMLENKNIGGNARFWYSEFHASVTIQNTSLEIHNSWFMYGHLNHYMGYSFASGLIIFIYIPLVNVTIDKIIVKNNTGIHGGNMAIQVTDFRENTSSIAISNSVVDNGLAKRGGGLQFWVQLHNGYSRQSVKMTHHFIMNITNTNFTTNSAGESGGGIYIGHYASKTKDFIVRHISFKGCFFSRNSVHYSKGKTISYSGAAIQVIRHNIDDFVLHSVPQYLIDFKECVFENNELKDVANEGGILDFVSTRSIIIIDCTFSFNGGTAISLRQSNIKFLGFNNTFKGNTGIHGGAMKFCELSKMYLPNNSVQINFINNSANSSGGAIYVSQQLCFETAPPCFFQPIRDKNRPKYYVPDIKLSFVNNTAGLAGDAVYGGQVNHCYLYYSKYDNHSNYLSQRDFEKIFDLKGQRPSLSNVSSNPYGACFYDISSDELDCHDETYPNIIYPGQSFIVYVAAVGQRNGISPVSSGFFLFKESDPDSDSCLEVNSHHNNISGKNNHYASLDCTIYSNRSIATFNLTLQEVSQAEVRYIKFNKSNLTVKLGECPWGFVLTEVPPYKCVCDNLLIMYKIPCNIDTQFVTRQGFYWIGCANSKSMHITNQTEHETNDNAECKGLVVAIKCVLDYCRMDETNISFLTLDDQCSEGREGILCGRCKENYTLSLGTSRCLAVASCPSYMVYIIAVSCVASGILLILFLIACNINMTEGTINGLLFYAHIMHKNSNLFFPGSVGSPNTNIFRLFIAWLNLDLGFEVCFYKSMTQYQKVWLEFGFLFYIWSLKCLIIVLSRKYIFFTRLVGRNVVKVLATLSLVCFPKLFTSALSSLEFAYIQYSDNHKTIVWQLDGNLRYLSGKHIPLFILGTLLILLALSYTLALLFIQCLEKQSRLFCFSWVNRLRPFFEAHTGPCHVYYRFWPGCLYFARLVLFSLCSHLIITIDMNPYIIMTTCAVLLIMAFVLPNRVYKSWPLNVLESIFIFNLGVVSGLIARLSYTDKGHTNTPYFVNTSVSLTMVLFGGILVYHSTKQLLPYRCCQKLRCMINLWISKLKFKRFKWFNIEQKRHEQEDPEMEPFLRHGMRRVAHFSQYREILIED